MRDDENRCTSIFRGDLAVLREVSKICATADSWTASDDRRKFNVQQHDVQLAPPTPASTFNGCQFHRCRACSLTATATHQRLKDLPAQRLPASSVLTAAHRADTTHVMQAGVSHRDTVEYSRGVSRGARSARLAVARSSSWTRPSSDPASARQPPALGKNVLMILRHDEYGQRDHTPGTGNECWRPSCINNSRRDLQGTDAWT